MSSWDMGYHSETLYTYLYFEATNPLWNRFIMAHRGKPFAEMGKGSCGCELGFGQGMSINIHAIASETEWYGNDFNPTQVRFAQHTADIGKCSNVHLYDESFEQFAKRDDLPKFDYIYIHGIWSWINHENQQYIVDFIKKNLKLGGVVYISYNVSPGNTLTEPARNLMLNFDRQLLASTVDNDARIQALREFMFSLFKYSPLFVLNNPMVVQNIMTVFNKDPSYVTSEYLNDMWDIIHFREMAETLEQAKLQFATSSSDGEMLDHFFFNKEQQELLNMVSTDVIMYEELRDFLLHQYFRRDLFVKGDINLTPSQRLKQLRELKFINISQDPQSYDYELIIAKNKVELPRSYYEPLMQLSADYKVHSYAEVLDTLSGKNVNGHIITQDELIEALSILTLTNVFMPAVALEDIPEHVLNRCLEFNRYLLLEETDTPIKQLISPVCQNGLVVDGIGRIMLREYVKNKNIDAQGLEKVLHDITSASTAIGDGGKRPEDMQEMIKTTVDKFIRHSLPVYKALKVVD